MSNRQNQKVKLKRRKIKSPIVRALSIVLLLVSAYLIYGVANELLTTMELKKQLSAVESELSKIQSENESLTSQKEKLQDPNYVQSYARGNYMLSKEGEKIFYLPAETQPEE